MGRLLLKNTRFFNKAAWIFFLLFFDVTAFYSAVFLNNVLSEATFIECCKNFLATLKPTLPLLTVLIPFMAYQRLYTKRLPVWDEIKQIVKIVICISLIMSLMIASQPIAGKAVVIGSFLRFQFLTILFVSIFRIFWKKVLRSMGLGLEKVMIVGAGNAGISVLRGLELDKHMGYKVIGFLDDDPNKKGLLIDGIKVFGGTRHITKFLTTLQIETVIIAIPSLTIAKLSELNNNIQRYTKRILLIPDLKGIALLNTELYHLFMQQIFLLEIHNNLKNPYNRAVKQLSDIVFSIVMAPVVFLVIGIIGLLIKLESRGPIFYTHMRVGHNGRNINVIKFRSMYMDADKRLKDILENNAEASEEWNMFYKLKDDPRITRVGKFLRSSSLDELPQIFNVLKGEMSLVGPRPVLQNEIDKYYRENAEYYFLVKPGITGLWQISGRNNISYDYRVKLDTWYVLNWSLWLDIIIMLKTLKVVFKMEGAY